MIEYEIIHDHSADVWEAYAIHNGEDCEWIATCFTREDAITRVRMHQREHGICAV